MDDAPLRAAADEAMPDSPPVRLHMPVDVRSAALVVLAVIALVVVLRWASPVFIPLMLGVMISYALTPVVDRLAAWRVPRALGAGVLLLALVGAGGTTVYALSDETAEVIDSLPDAALKLRRAVRAQRGEPEGAIDKLQQAATQIEQAAAQATSPSTPAAERGVLRVQVERPKFSVKDYLWTGALGLVSLMGQTVIVIFLVYFLLASGNTFRRKIVRIAGSTFTKKKLTLQALDEVSAQMQRYLLVQLLLSLLVGVATWAAFAAIGLEHAAVWGLAAAVLNLVPYVGSIAVTAAASLVAFVQFGSAEMAALVGGASLVINLIEGYLLMPWLTSRTSRMNPVAVFIGVLAWGWLWGVWGLLLGVPILMVVKAACERVDDLHAVGELLGE
jgi:predicted PurR-regulated permease PerM